VNLTKVLAQLRLELENLDMAIASLERLATQKETSPSEALAEPKRRGRPPKHSGHVADADMAMHKRSAK
jgi:hypothetical protein